MIVVSRGGGNSFEREVFTFERRGRIYVNDAVELER